MVILLQDFVDFEEAGICKTFVLMFTFTFSHSNF